MKETPVLLLQPWPFPPPTPNPTLRILLPLLVEKGYRFHVLAPQGAGGLLLPGFHLQEIPFRFRAHQVPSYGGHLVYLWELIRWNRLLVTTARQRVPQRPRLVLGFSGAVAPAVERLARYWRVPGVLKLFGITYFLQYRPTPGQWLQNQENLRAFRSRVQGLILVEDGTGGETAAQRWQVPAQVWVEPQAYPEVWPRRGRYTRDTLHLDPQQQVLLVVGRLAAIKGVRFLPKILAHLDPKIPWVLVLAGDGPERRRLEQAFRQQGLLPRVRFLGTVAHEDLGDLYALATVYLGVSPVANVTLPVVEALASGVPVVAFDCQETGRVLRTPAVQLVPPFQVQAFAQALARWLRNPQERQQRAREAREFARRRFLTWPQVADFEHRVFQTLLRNAHS